MHRVRLAKIEDTDKIKAIDHIVPLEEDRITFIKNSVKAGHTYVLEKDDDILGYGVLKYDFFGCPFIEMIYIDEQNRGQNLGPVLIDFFVKQIEGNKIFTSTNQSNKHMQHVLEKLGWVRSGIIENLDEGDPEIIYVRKQ